jgi:hypothetical protein
VARRKVGTQMDEKLRKLVEEYTTGDLIPNLKKLQDILNTTIISCKFVTEKQKKDSLSIFHGILFTLELFDENIQEILTKIN